jgi:type VI secretion system secreted protein Hcp
MAVDMFMKVGTIKGEAKDNNKPSHADEINVLSWHWGMTQQGASQQGPGAGAGRADVQDLSFTHYIDLASPNLIKFCCAGTPIDTAVLTLRKAGTQPVEYLKITLSGVIVSGVTTGTPSGHDLFTETVSLHFSKFKLDYTPQTDKGGPGASSSVEWDIANNA